MITKEYIKPELYCDSYKIENLCMTLSGGGTGEGDLDINFDPTTPTDDGSY